MSQRPARCYLLVGADRARKRQRVAQLAQTFQVALLDRHHVSAAEVSAAELAALAREHPAASPVRLLVIEEAQRLDRACLALVTEQWEGLTQVACLILLVDGEPASAHPLAALARSVVVERFEIVGGAPGAQRFALVEAIARRDVAAACRAMQEQLALGKDVTDLVGMLVWQLSRWLTVRRCLEAAMPQERMRAAAGLEPWQLQRVLQDVADRSSTHLRQLLERCWEVDVAIKTGRTVPRVALEALVVACCLPRPSVTVAGRGGTFEPSVHASATSRASGVA